MAGRDFEQFKRHSRPVSQTPSGLSRRQDFQRHRRLLSVTPGGWACLDRQDRDDFLNIRDPFLSSEAEHGKLVVHGHTPSVAPEIRPNRIGIDTAAYATNRLTCLVLEKDQRRFLHVGDDSGLQRGNQ